MREVARRVLEESLFAGCNVVLFEDADTSTDLFPLAVLRPSWEIRSGAGCLRGWLNGLQLPSMNVLLRPRPELNAMAVRLAGIGEDPYDPESETVFLNGRVIGLWKEQEVARELPPALGDQAGRVLYLRMEGRRAEALLSLAGNELGERLVQESEPGELPSGWTLLSADHVWDFMAANQTVLNRQLGGIQRGTGELMGARPMREPPPGAHVTEQLGGHNVYLGAGVKCMPGVVFGTHAGPIWIGPHTEIEAHAYLEGPLYIGSHSRVKAGARLYRGSSFGSQCRVGGEITGTIMQAFCNKQHDGFLGDSHLGQWVNLGADTRNSNLRNDYTSVKVQVGGRLVDTGRDHVGMFCGDHTKTGINTMINTGTVIGVGCNVYGAEFPPRFVPSFSWGGAARMIAGRLDRTLITARTVMERRGEELSAVEEELLRRHYRETVKQEILP